MELDERDKLIRQAVLLSEDAKKFKASTLCGVMLARAEQEAEEAAEALCQVDASEVARILQLQADVRRARSFPAWIDEIIFEGDQAYDMYVAENYTQEEK